MVAACGAAALFGPGLVASAGAVDFTPGPGAYTADTSALTLTGPGVSVTGQNMGGVAVFNFANINIPAGATIFATGSRPFELQASGSFNLDGVIDGNGTSALNFDQFPTTPPPPNAGGAGGGFGGKDSTQPGGGSGGGGVASAGSHGAGGGGFGGAGAPGGCDPPSCPSGQTAGAGGNAYGNLDVLFQGGSGGGGASGPAAFDSVAGGGGGGAIAIFAGSLTTTSGSVIEANGGDGAVGGSGASGGGSGGGILLHANTINVNGLLSATGGKGGAGGCCGDGGGGAGGRIAYQYAQLVSGGATDVTGGFSGANSNPPGFTSGGPSPVPQAGSGVVSQIRGALAGFGPATGISQTAATISGFINPNGNGTTYHFDFGTTTAYGMQVPGFDVFVGSDFAVHQVTQTVSGLSPNTTYHYRLVATDSIGLVTLGPDQSFTTAPLPPPTASATVAALGSGAAVTVSCSGASSQTCAGQFVVTAHKHTCGRKTTGVTASAKPKCKPKTTQVRVGSGRYSVGAGRSQTIHFSVNSTGKSLLTQFYKLPSTWKFSATSGFAPHTRQVKFAYQRIMATPDDFNLAVGAGSALVKSWFITGIPTGGSAAVVCNGGGCSFHSETFKHKHKVSILSGAHLAVGATIRITITAPNSVGMVDTVTIRSLDAPKESFSCLPPGARSPMKCVG